MSAMPLDIVPEAHRDLAATALDHVTGPARPVHIEPVTGGASGALIYRVSAGNRGYLLRLETHRGALRNPHQYTCMARAAEAGIAPPVHFVDAERGVVVMDFIASHPLQTFPGGPPALARAAGQLAARLQSTAGFPDLADYQAILKRMMSALQTSAVFAPGLLTPHAKAFERLAAAYPWDVEPKVASHNDPNARNILFDGARLWLVDWETAYRNDPMTDVAILVENLAGTDDLETALLTSWRGCAPDAELRARLQLMRVLTRLYYAGLVLGPFAIRAPAVPDTDLAAPTLEQLSASVAAGELAVGTPAFMRVFGKMLLAGFLEGTRTPQLEASLAVLGAA